ncbi:MAG: DUF2752 domain-containing protein [Deltaproteobacteria bacterium]|nr:DUF2752 domain-containing protein [Deltaproteobacteria bacterium]
MHRTLHGVMAVGIGIGLMALAHLSPSMSGYGTHQALGLPPCLLTALTGITCPSCGLTTSVVHCLHGEWLAALKANTVGPFLLIGILTIGGANLYGIVRPFAWGTVVATAWFHRVVVCAISALFLAWGLRGFW